MSVDHYPSNRLNELAYHDLMDNGEDGAFENTDQSAFTTITDNVDGFSNFDLFQTLGDEARDIGQYQNDLGVRFPQWRGNATADVNALFNSY